MADDLYWRIKAAAGTVIAGLNLPGIGAQVYGQAVMVGGLTAGYRFDTGEVQDILFPAVILTGDGEEDELLGGQSEGKEGIFPQRCWIVDKVEAGVAHGKESVYLTARKTIIEAFRQQKLAGVPEVVTCDVSPRVLFDPRAPQFETIVSAMVLRFRWAQSRY